MASCNACLAVLLLACVELGLRMPAAYGAPPTPVETTAKAGGDNVVAPTAVITMRLAAGGAYHGRLEVQIGGAWGAICSTGFGREEARVACRELGLRGGAVDLRNYPHGKLRYAVRNVLCRGDERRLASCRYALSNICPSGQPAGVTCKRPVVLAARFGAGSDNNGPYSPAPYYGAAAPSGPYIPYVPPVSQGPTGGRLEVLLQDGSYGTVCDSGFGDREARVACRFLGLGGGRALKGAAYGPGTAPVRLGGVRCKGNELNLTQCAYTINPPCSHARDVSVECVAPPEVKVRLAGSNSTNRGRLEVRVGGRWGTVCGKGGFNQAAAELVCAKLGMSGGKVLPNARFGPGKGPIHMAGVRCNSASQELSACVFTTRTGNCKHSQDISIVCKRPVLVGTILYNTGPGNTGYLLAGMTNGRSVNVGKVCRDGFTVKEARVACRSMFGVKGGNVLPAKPEPSWMKQFNFVVRNIHCKGPERDTTQCLYEASSDCPSSKPVEISCPVI